MRKRFQLLSISLFVFTILAIWIIPGYAQRSSNDKKDKNSKIQNGGKTTPPIIKRFEDRGEKKAGQKKTISKSTLTKAASFAPVYKQAVRFDVSKPLRSMKSARKPAVEGPIYLHEKRELHSPREMVAKQRARTGAPRSTDPLLRPVFPGPNMPVPFINFEGAGQTENEFYFDPVAPPDTNGDVGPKYYIQTVNLVFTIFDKDGNPLLPPLPMSVLFSGFGGVCETSDDGDRSRTAVQALWI